MNKTDQVRPRALAHARNTSASERAESHRAWPALSLAARKALTLQQLFEDAAGLRHHLFEQAVAEFGRTCLRVADDAKVCDVAIVRPPRPGHRQVEHRAAHAIAVRRILE